MDSRKFLYDNNELFQSILLPSQDLPASALYVVGLPIGNLGDITLRALWVLSKADCIAAEDTRETRKLLEKFNIESHLFPVHQHNEHEGAEKVLTYLAEGKRVALVTDAGTPAVSDIADRSSTADKTVRTVPCKRVTEKRKGSASGKRTKQNQRRELGGNADFFKNGRKPIAESVKRTASAKKRYCAEHCGKGGQNAKKRRHGIGRTADKGLIWVHTANQGICKQRGNEYRNHIFHFTPAPDSKNLQARIAAAAEKTEEINVGRTMS